MRLSEQGVASPIDHHTWSSQMRPVFELDLSCCNHTPLQAASAFVNSQKGQLHGYIVTGGFLTVMYHDPAHSHN